MADPEDRSVFRTEGLTEAERDDLIRARAWLNLNQPPKLTPGEAAGLTPQQVDERNAWLRDQWLEYRKAFGMSPTPPYQASDSAIVGVLVLPDGRRVRIQSRKDPGPDVRSILGSQTMLRRLDDGRMVSTTSTWGPPTGPGSGVSGNLVHIEPWTAAVMNRLEVKDAVLWIELPMCKMCNYNPEVVDAEDAIPNFARMLPPNSRVTLVNPEYAETIFSVHGPRGPGYDLRRIDYESKSPAGPRLSTEALRQARYRARTRRGSAGFIDLGAPFSIGKSPGSLLTPGRLAAMRRAAPHVGDAAAGVGVSLIMAYIAASIEAAANEQRFRDTFDAARPRINQDLAGRTDEIMRLLASGQRAYANVQMLDTYEEFVIPDVRDPQLTQTPSWFEYGGTTVSSQPRDGDVDLGPERVSLGQYRNTTTHTFSFELKIPPEVVAAYMELAEGIKWLDVAVEDPFLDRDEVLFLSLRKQELEKLSQELFSPPTNLPLPSGMPPLPRPPVPKPGPAAKAPGGTLPPGASGSAPGANGAGSPGGPRAKQRVGTPPGGGPSQGGGGVAPNPEMERVLSVLTPYKPGAPGMSESDIGKAYQVRYHDYAPPSLASILEDLNRQGKITLYEDHGVQKGGGKLLGSRKRAWKN
jgi:hypothetical protein